MENIISKFGVPIAIVTIIAMTLILYKIGGPIDRFSKLKVFSFLSLLGLIVFLNYHAMNN
jgi:hypothetical protein